MRKLMFMLALMAAVPAGAQNTKAPLDGQNRQFFDDLLDHLPGPWKMTGQILGQTVTHRVAAEWALNHQFLHFHEKDTADPPAYEVDVYIGYDNMSERYVAHWLESKNSDGKWTNFALLDISPAGK